ncbi:hypothetical protein Aca07nite_29810 [Actinoplanes capillaceus]|uniref:Uncharacterized protein n=1 Tax=Actinoplanes campanulatus TaxID=113559 RepID=A0ABQ3WHI4_9ACTN|nr:hypothetical protein [Actinoplanes capillaceus]GID45706.1 hypothetical protein Aca07nite_29810 [Actinoplanes capillaceus]
MNLTAQDEIAVYVEGVRLALAGLPPATRDELLEDLPEHLAEVLAEGGGSLTDRLGPPEAYAAELSASAGFATAGQPTSRYAAVTGRAARHRARISEAVQRADVRVGPILGYARASEFLVLLRPAWWVLRGYLAAMAIAFMFDGNSRLGLMPRLGGDDFAAVLLLALGILGSIWLGRRGTPARKWPRRALRLATVYLVFFALIGFFEVDSAAKRDGYSEVGYTGWNEFTDVRDVYVYDGDGRLISGVQLYDQDGNPIRLGEPYCDDPASGMSVPSRTLGYPHCPEAAPYHPGDPSAVTPPTPDTSTPASATPSAPAASPNASAPGASSAPAASSADSPSKPPAPAGGAQTPAAKDPVDSAKPSVPARVG